MKRFTKITCIFLTLAMILSFAACGSGAGGSTEGGGGSDAASDTITVTDHVGNTVTLPKDIERIAICDIYPIASVLSVFFNSAEKIVAMPKQSMTAAQNSLLGELYPEILDTETECVSGAEINTEELMALEPDVVFYSASSTAIGEQLINAGFNAVAISVNKWDYNCIETLKNWISLFSQIFPESDKAAIVESKSDEIYSFVQERVADLSDSERARAFVLFQYTDTNLMTSGENFFGQWWCDAIGAVNVANELKNDNASVVNMEQIYSWNPDTILMTNFMTAKPDDLYNNTVGTYDWSEVDAVKEKRVYKMPLGMYRSYTPGVDTPVALLWMAKTVYPELFTDVDVTAEAKSYYSEVFGIDLTDEQINSIFAPAAAAGSGF